MTDQQAEGQRAEGEAPDFDTILRRVRRLMEKANDLTENHIDPESLNEAKALMAKADALMTKYAVTEAALQAARPIDRQRVPQRKFIVICDGKNPARGYLVTIANVLAEYCRLRLILIDYGTSAEVCANLYGFESDLAFYDVLFTTIFLHLGGKLYPKWDESQSRSANVVRLHHQGLNWLDLAKIDPEVLWLGRGRDPRPDTLVGSRQKRIYYKWCEDHNQKPRIVVNRVQFLRSFAFAYQDRIYERVQEMMSGREPGAALVLADSGAKLDAWLKERIGETKTIRLDRSHSIDSDAYAAGDKAAKEADLTGGRNRMGNDNKELS